MNPLDKDEIKGNWATLLLPIRANDQIDYVALGDEIDYLIQAGVDGIYSNGTAGEFYNQTEEEFDRIHLMFAEKCNFASMPFQVGCSQMSPQITLERVRRAKQLMPSAIQVILPDWWMPTDREIYTFLERVVAEAHPVGIVLYNPPHAKRRLMPQDFKRIADAGITLVGCKVAGGDDQWYSEMRQYMAHLSVFIPGHFLATGLQQGADGAYSNVSCLHPVAAQKWYRLMVEDMGSALETEGRIRDFMRTCIQPYLTSGFSNQAADKFLATVGGWATMGTRLRWPYASIPETDVAGVRAIAKQMLPEFFQIGAVI